MNILALDPATKCGWATSISSGTWDLSVRRDESGGMKLIRLRAKLAEVVKACDINLLVYEAARHAAPGQQGALVFQAELQSVIKLFCEDNKIDYRGFSPSEIKKHGTGKGNSGKPLMIKAACRITGREITDDNEADALILLDLAATTYGVKK